MQEFVAAQSRHIATQSKDFRRLCSALRVLEKKGGDARISDTQLIEAVAERGPQTYQQLGEVLGLSSSAASRTVLRLSAVNRKGGQGFGLLTTERDPQEGRRFLEVLSPKGRAFIQSLEQT